MTWWNSQRSAYGKVTRTVSGQAAKRLTAREERLKERLSFLNAHVYRVPKRAGVNVSIMTNFLLTSDNLTTHNIYHYYFTDEPRWN